MCTTALPLSMTTWKNPARIPRSGAMGVKIQMIATSTASVSHPYQWAYMDNSRWRKTITSSKKNICWNPAATIPFSVHLHTSIRLMTVFAG